MKDIVILLLRLTGAACMMGASIAGDSISSVRLAVLACFTWIMALSMDNDR